MNKHDNCYILLIQQVAKKFSLPCLHKLNSIPEITIIAFLLWVLKFEKLPKVEFLFKSRDFCGYGKINLFNRQILKENSFTMLEFG